MCAAGRTGWEAYGAVKRSIRKRLGPASGRKHAAGGGKVPARKAAAPAKESRATRYRYLLAEIEAQIAVLKAALDGAPRVPEEAEAG